MFSMARSLLVFQVSCGEFYYSSPAVKVSDGRTRWYCEVKDGQGDWPAFTYPEDVDQVIRHQIQAKGRVTYRIKRDLFESSACYLYLVYWLSFSPSPTVCKIYLIGLSRLM